MDPLSSLCPILWNNTLRGPLMPKFILNNTLRGPLMPKFMLNNTLGPHMSKLCSLDQNEISSSGNFLLFQEGC